MNFLEKKNIKPAGVYYQFTEEEITKLVVDFVAEQTGAKLDLMVSCLDDTNFDVYVQWDEEDKERFEETASEELQKAVRDFGLTESEDFMNRDTIFERMFKSESIGYECNTWVEESTNKVESQFTFYVTYK